MNRWIVLLSWLGVFIAGVLTAFHYAKAAPPCGVSMGCAIVAQDPSSEVAGLPVALLGVLGYLAVGGLGVARALFGKERWKLLAKVGLFGSLFGVLFSAYLTYLSVVEIQATCLWCLSSAVTMLIVFALHIPLVESAPPEASPARVDPWLMAGGFLVALVAIAIQYGVVDKEANRYLKAIDVEKLDVNTLLPAKAKTEGPDDAPVTIIEIADYNCPSCRKSNPMVEELRRNYAGRVRWAFRNLPLWKLKGHETSVVAAMIAEYAAEQGKFWAFHDEVMRPENNENVKSVEGLYAVAAKVGLDAKVVRQKVESHDDALLDRVNEDQQAAKSVGITATPTFVVFAHGEKPKAVGNGELEGLLHSEPIASMIVR